MGRAGAHFVFMRMRSSCAAQRARSTASTYIVLAMPGGDSLSSIGRPVEPASRMDWKTRLIRESSVLRWAGATWSTSYKTALKIWPCEQISSLGGSSE